MWNRRRPSFAALRRGGHARARAVAATLALALMAAIAQADDRADHDRAREAVRSGQVLPLRSVLHKLEASHPGQVLEVELERKGERWVYEIKLLQADGKLLKLHLDARTAEVLRSREKNDKKPDK
jgi:uncharacterized membrane protein YkoI